MQKRWPGSDCCIFMERPTNCWNPSICRTGDHAWLFISWALGGGGALVTIQTDGYGCTEELPKVFAIPSVRLEISFEIFAYEYPIRPSMETRLQ